MNQNNEVPEDQSVFTVYSIGTTSVIYITSQQDPL